jgi:hypothetical protein
MPRDIFQHRACAQCCWKSLGLPVVDELDVYSQSFWMLVCPPCGIAIKINKELQMIVTCIAFAR